MIEHANTNDIRFIGGFEGFASRAYRCPAGVITIGRGFTMGSQVFAEWWLRKHGRPLRMGDTMAQADADAVFAIILDREYGAAASGKLGAKPHHQWAGATSTAFNCGTGALAWRWARALARGDVKEAGRLLRVTAITANGRKLPPLQRRRDAEAHLIETGDYGFSILVDAQPSVSRRREDVRWYQLRLKRLGYQVAVSGRVNATDSEAAVRTFQMDHELKVDGKVGPATRAAIIRALDAKAQHKATIATGATGGAAGGGADLSNVPSIDPSTIDPQAVLHALAWGVGIAVAVGAVVALGYLAWRYRGVITGRRVPT